MEGGRRRTIVVVLLTLALVTAGVGGGWAYYLNHQIDEVRRIAIDFGPDRSPALGPDEWAAATQQEQTDSVETDASEDGGQQPGSSATPAPGPETKDDEPERPEARPLTILLAGVDAGDGPRIADEMAAGSWTPGRYRSDTIMVLHLPADRRSATVVSIPRDSWVRVPGHGMRKVNAAFSLGGPSLLVRTVQRLTRVDIDHLMIVDWQAFKRITTAVGGVRVRIPQDVYDVKQDVHWEAGVHELEGERALQYVRQRYGLPRGDFNRIDRQQNFIRATLRKVLSNETLLHPVKLTRIMEAVGDHFLVDEALTSDKLRRLALSSRHLRGDSVRFVTVPTTGIDRVRGRSVVRVDQQQIRRLFGALANDRIERYLRRNDVDRLDEPGRIR